MNIVGRGFRGKICDVSGEKKDHQFYSFFFFFFF